MTRLAAAIDRLTDWYVSRALPLWARACADERGGFYESLDFDARPIVGQNRRVRVQCRQIYTFSDATLRGWLPEGEAIAAKGFKRLIETACPDAGARGCIHIINDGGTIIDARRDLYDQAFLLLSCAVRIKATGDPAARDLAKKTLAFLDRELASPFGGYREDDKGTLPRRQNPHMHLFEATMALHAASGDSSMLARARAIEALFGARFLDRASGALREFFNDDWSPDAENGDKVEPGHMAEWTYLIDRFEALSGEDRSSEKRMLYDGACRFVFPGAAPFLPNFAILGGKLSRGARRLWPQTEFLRAALVMAEAGDSSAAGQAADLIDALFATYLNQKTSGLWCDEYDDAGAPIAKDVPASILYHIHEAVCCAADCRDRLNA